MNNKSFPISAKCTDKVFPPIIYVWHWDSLQVNVNSVQTFVSNVRLFFGAGYNESFFRCFVRSREKSNRKLTVELSKSKVDRDVCKGKWRYSEDLVIKTVDDSLHVNTAPLTIVFIHNDDVLELYIEELMRTAQQVFVITIPKSRSRRVGLETWSVDRRGVLQSGLVCKTGSVNRFETQRSLKGRSSLNSSEDSAKSTGSTALEASEYLSPNTEFYLPPGQGFQFEHFEIDLSSFMSSETTTMSAGSGSQTNKESTDLEGSSPPEDLPSCKLPRDSGSNSSAVAMAANSNMVTSTPMTTGTQRQRKPPPLNLTNSSGPYVHWCDVNGRPMTPRTPRNGFSTGLQVHNGPSKDSCYNLWPPVMFQSTGAGQYIRTPITPRMSSTPREPLTPGGNQIGNVVNKMTFRKTPGASRPGNLRNSSSPMNKGSGGAGPASALFQGNRTFQPRVVPIGSSILAEDRRVVNGSGGGCSGGSGGMVNGLGLSGRRISSSSPPVMARPKSEDDSEPVEVKVTNLDYNISGREWKKILTSEFQQQVQVLGVHVQTQADNTTEAYVQLSTIEEARYAISQFHRKKIGYKRIHVALNDSSVATSSSNIRLEVVALLQSVSVNTLPLFKFIELYEKRYHRTISVSELYRLRDVVEIQESSGSGRTVSLVNRGSSPALEQAQEVVESPVCELHCKDGMSRAAALDASGLPHVMLSLKTFAPQVHTLLQAHQGSMALISFSVCYEVEFRSALESVRDGGVPLEHLLSCVPGILVVVTPRSGVKKVQWAENKPVMPIEWPSRASVSSNSPLLSSQLSQFSREVVDLLRHQKACRMPFSNFIPAYHHHFGRQCRVADYGYTKLVELFEAIPHVVQILGEGNRRLITLSHRAQVKRFTGDLLRVLKYQSSKQIHADDIPIVYNKVASRAFDITDYGVCFMEDMLAEIPENTIVIEGQGSDMIIALPRKDQTGEERERTRQFALEVVDLLKNSPQCQIPFNKFIPGYHHHFGRQCRVSDYGFSKLQELFEAIPDVVAMREEEGEKVLCLTHPELVKVLREHIVVLLKKYPGHRIAVEEFLLAYMQHYGNSISFRDYGVASVLDLIGLVPDVAMMELSDKHDEIIVLVDHSEMERLAKRVLLLLMDRRDGQMGLHDLLETYHSAYGCDLSQEEIDKLIAQKYIEIWQPRSLTGSPTSPEDEMIRLSPLQQFSRDMRTLLRVHQGRLPLSMLESAYQQHFGVALVTHGYGYPSLVSLLEAIKHVVCLRGKGYRRTILLAHDFQDKLKEGTERISSGSPSSDSGITEDESLSLNQQSVSPDGSTSVNNKYNTTATGQPVNMNYPMGSYMNSTFMSENAQPQYVRGYPIVGNGTMQAVPPPSYAIGTPSPMLQYAASLLPQTVYPHCPPMTNGMKNGMMQARPYGGGMLLTPDAAYQTQIQPPTTMEQLTYIAPYVNKPPSLEESLLGAPVFHQNEPANYGNVSESYDFNLPNSYDDQNTRLFEVEDLDCEKADLDSSKNGFARKSRLAARFSRPLSPSTPTLNSSI